MSTKMRRFDEGNHPAEAIRSTLIAVGLAWMGVLVAAIVAAPHSGPAARGADRSAVGQAAQQQAGPRALIGVTGPTALSGER